MTTPKIPPHLLNHLDYYAGDRHVNANWYTSFFMPISRKIYAKTEVDKFAVIGVQWIYHRAHDSQETYAELPVFVKFCNGDVCCTFDSRVIPRLDNCVEGEDSIRMGDKVIPSIDIGKVQLLRQEFEREHPRYFIAHTPSPIHTLESLQVHE